MLENEIFKKAKPDLSKIKKYGFILVPHTDKNTAEFVFEKEFMNGEFKCIIKIDKNGGVSGKVYDTANGEEYLPLRKEYQTDGFSSNVRAEYENILKDILNNCFNQEYFISKQANRICDLIYQKYNVAPDFPWKGQKTASDAAVFRKEAGGKWFGLIMNVKKNKIIPEAKGNIDIINLKLENNKIQNLIKKEGFYPAYHMNKKYWITIALDDTLPDEEIMKYIIESFQNVK